MNSFQIAKSYAMTEIAGRGVCFVGEGKRFFDGIEKSFTLPYTDCHLEPIVSFLTTNRITHPYKKREGCLFTCLFTGTYGSIGK